MRRVSEVISASLLASTAILAPGACVSAATPAASGPAHCLPRSAHTLAVDRTARVFSLHGSVYGCIDATGGRRNLGGGGICNAPPGRVAPVGLTGEIVAYGLERCGVDTGFSTIVVRDLATGRRLADRPAAILPVGPESYVSVASLVLQSDGAVGWIAGDSSLVSHRGTTFEVHRFEGGKSSLLDSGRAIQPTSLRLAGSRMTWRDGGVTRSASLS